MAEKKYDLKSNPKGFEKLNYNLPSEADKWSPDYFYNAFNGLNNLQKIDLSSKEGLKDFYKIVSDPSVKSGTMEFTKAAHKTLVQMVNEGFVQNSLKNYGGIVGLLDGEAARGLALSSPGVYTKDADEKYIAAAKAIVDNQKVSYDVKNNPKDYLERRFEGLDDRSKEFWGRLSKQILENDVRISQRRAVESLNGFGSVQKYLTENMKYARILSEEYSNKEAEFKNKLAEAYKKEVDRKGGHLNPSEELEFQEAHKKEQEAFVKKYEMGATASQSIPKILEGAIGNAYETLDAKKKEEAKKKAEEAKKKK